MSGGTVQGLKNCLPGRPKRLPVAMANENEIVE
jgi:hypothetical protein